MKGKIFNNLDSLNEFVKNERKIISNQTIKKTVDDVSNRTWRSSFKHIHFSENFK